MSSPQSRAARQRSAMAKQQEKGLAAPLNFLLTCSEMDLDNFELARLAEVANLRAELHELLDRLIDTNAQAALIRWFRVQDRQTLKHAIENEETPEEWARRMIREGQRSEEEQADYLLPMPMPNQFRPSLPPGAAHLAAAKRYSERHIAKGLCEKCPEPLAHHSVRYCEKHLAMVREKDRRDNHRRGKRGNPNLEPGTREYLYGAEEVPLSTHGRQPGTLASLAMNREKRTRSLLLELGIKPEHAAVSLQAAKEALLLKLMPNKAHAMTQAELFERAGGISNTTGQKALKALLAEKKIQRIGAGGVREPYHYFLKR